MAQEQPVERDMQLTEMTMMVLDEDGWIRIYTNSSADEHNDGRKFPPEETICYVTISRWRRDGFCALESHSDTGSVLLRADVDLVYGFVPETTLAGDYIPNRCY